MYYPAPCDAAVITCGGSSIIPDTDLAYGALVPFECPNGPWEMICPSPSDTGGSYDFPYTVPTLGVVAIKFTGARGTPQGLFLRPCPKTRIAARLAVAVSPIGQTKRLAFIFGTSILAIPIQKTREIRGPIKTRPCQLQMTTPITFALIDRPTLSGPSSRESLVAPPRAVVAQELPPVRATEIGAARHQPVAVVKTRSVIRTTPDQVPTYRAKKEA